MTYTWVTTPASRTLENHPETVRRREVREAIPLTTLKNNNPLRPAHGATAQNLSYSCGDSARGVCNACALRVPAAIPADDADLRTCSLCIHGGRASCPPRVLSKSLIDNGLADQASGLAASGQCRPGNARQSMASDVAILVDNFHSESVPLPPAVTRVAEAWLRLAPHIREAILTLVDAGQV